MKHLIPYLALCLTLSSVACKDDPELVEKSATQRAEITRLEIEVGLMEEKLKNVPRDVSYEMKELETLANEQTAEIDKLEKQLLNISAQKKSVQQEFDTYRQTYQVK